MRFWARSFCFALLAAPAVASASPHEVRVPLDHGRLDVGAMARALGDEARLPDEVLAYVPGGSIDVSGVAGWAVVRGLNHALGAGLQARVDSQALTITVDPEKLPRTLHAARRAARRFTEEAADKAIDRRARRYGLHLPQTVDARRPMVLLVHGLDGEAVEFKAIEQLLEADGKQVAFFGYPDHDSIESNAEFFGQNVRALRETFPGMHLDVVAHSMGCLVVRGYIEGGDYAGGIDHFVLVGPPNHGSGWAKLEVGGDLLRHAALWRSDREWSPAWLADDVLGEAGGELKPGSKFLARLNALPRRDGVRYTIVAGDQPISCEVGSELLEGSSKLIPAAASRWWGFRQTKSMLEHKAEKLASKPGDADGPVKLKSARLAGVDDFVVLHANHTSLISAHDGGRPPIAWETIRARLDGE